MKNSRIHQRLKEDTPSKLHRQAAKAGIEGFEVKPEDEWGIDKGRRKLRIMARKNQLRGFLTSGGGVERLKRKFNSPMYTPGEAANIKYMLDRKKAEGKARKAQPGQAREGVKKNLRRVKREDPSEVDDIRVARDEIAELQSQAAGGVGSVGAKSSERLRISATTRDKAIETLKGMGITLRRNRKIAPSKSTSTEPEEKAG